MGPRLRSRPLARGRESVVALVQEKASGHPMFSSVFVDEEGFWIDLLLQL